MNDTKSAIERIEKQYGKGAIFTMSDTPEATPSIPTGVKSIDDALGIGGVPRGRTIEVFGPEMAGKTAFCLHLIAQAQKAGGVCAFIDAEHSLDLTFARNIGVDVNKLLVSQPDNGEQALEICDILTRSGAVALIVVDSVANLVPRAELEGEMGDYHIGLHARLMSNALRKLTAAANRTGTTIVFTNQLRMKTGVTFGSPEMTTGGSALKFYSSVRIDIRRLGSIKKNDSIVATKVRVKIVKNKCAPPFKHAEVELWFDGGFREARG